MCHMQRQLSCIDIKVKEASSMPPACRIPGCHACVCACQMGMLCVCPTYARPEMSRVTHMHVKRQGLSLYVTQNAKSRMSHVCHLLKESYLVMRVRVRVRVRVIFCFGALLCSYTCRCMVVACVAACTGACAGVCGPRQLRMK